MERLVRLVMRQVDYLYDTELSYVHNALNFDLTYDALRACIKEQIVDGVLGDSFVSYVRCLIQTYGEYPVITAVGEVTFVDVKTFEEPYAIFREEFDSRVAGECAIMASALDRLDEFKATPVDQLAVLKRRVEISMPNAVKMAMNRAKEYSSLEPIRIVGKYAYLHGVYFEAHWGDEN